MYFFGFHLVDNPQQDGSRCVVLSPTCLGISDWRCDCVMTQPSWPRRRLQLVYCSDRSPCFAPFLSSPPLSKCCMVLTWPSECLLLEFQISERFCTCISCLSPCGLCKLIFLFHWNYWHFIFIWCTSWLKWLYLMVVVLLWVYDKPAI